MKKYYWEITYDHINRGEPDLAEVGRSGGDPKLKGKNGDKGHTFSLYVDDDELYFRGRIWGDFDGFEPQADLREEYGVTSTELDGVAI